MTRKILATILTLALLAGAGIGLAYFYVGITESRPGDAIYEGTEIFSTEGEYQEFKAILVSSEVELLDVAVLSSSPPIIVKFEVKTASLDLTFPYGERSLVGH